MTTTDDKYWWAFMEIDGKPFIQGPYMSETKARWEAKNMTSEYRLYELPTRDDARASRMIKAKRAEVQQYGR